MRTNQLQSQRGIATLIALIMVGMLTLIGIAALSTSDDEVKVAGNQMQEARAFYAAESALDIAAASLTSEFEDNGVVPSPLPYGEDSINGCNVTYQVDMVGSSAKKVLSVGNLAGLYGSVEEYSAVSEGLDASNRSGVRIMQNFEFALVPIYQFAAFFDGDLELSPGPEMTLIGRLHTNGDLYVQASNTFKMDSYISAAGSIYHGRKAAGTLTSGDIQIKNAKGKYVSMKQGSDWLDANDSWWEDSSTARWNGRVQDDAHGQPELELNLTNDDDPRKMVERGTGNPDSYEHKATLKFADGKILRKVSGTWMDVTVNMVANGIVSYANDKFYDARELQWVDCLDLDVKKMYELGYAPENGVLYLAGDYGAPGEFPALRLNNAAALGAALTVATPNPVYTKGNVNTSNKKPLSIIADAFTVLSNNWDDAKSTLPKTNRPANNTTVNCSIVTGSGESALLSYSGGLENLIRHLEDWAGDTFTWKGSAAKLWNSFQADGTFNYLYFNEPKRIWSFDTDLDDPALLPPSTPVAKVFQRTGWTQEHCGYRTDDSLILN